MQFITHESEITEDKTLKLIKPFEEELKCMEGICFGRMKTIVKGLNKFSDQLCQQNHFLTLQNDMNNDLIDEMEDKYEEVANVNIFLNNKYNEYTFRENSENIFDKAFDKFFAGDRNKINNLKIIIQDLDTQISDLKDEVIKRTLSKINKFGEIVENKVFERFPSPQEEFSHCGDQSQNKILNSEIIKQGQKSSSNDQSSSDEKDSLLNSNKSNSLKDNLYKEDSGEFSNGTKSYKSGEKFLISKVVHKNFNFKNLHESNIQGNQPVNQSKLKSPIQQLECPKTVLVDSNMNSDQDDIDDDDDLNDNLSSLDKESKKSKSGSNQSFDLESDDNSSKDLSIKIKPKKQNYIPSKKMSMVTSFGKPNQLILNLKNIKNNNQGHLVSSQRKMNLQSNEFNKFSLQNKNFGMRMSNIHYNRPNFLSKS